MSKEYNQIKNLVETIRKAQSSINENNAQHGKSLLKEEEEKSDANSVPYSKQDTLYNNSVQPCKTVFGADFSKLDNCMLYYKDDGDVTLSGVVPSMNNAKFQFRYLEPSGNGLFIWLDNLQLSDDILNRLNKMHGVYKNWRKMLTTNDDIKPLSLKNER